MRNAKLPRLIMWTQQTEQFRTPVPKLGKFKTANYVLLYGLIQIWKTEYRVRLVLKYIKPT